MSPTITISLDFELRWGMLDKLKADRSVYLKNLEGTCDACHGMLELMTRLGVRATWAIVGSIACEGWDEWYNRAPPWPHYLNKELVWNDMYRTVDPSGRLYFAKNVVDRISRTDGQELGSHTFCHLYFLEPGLVQRDVLADLDATSRLFKERWGRVVRSFVFPRNQVAFTDILRTHGISGWRDNADSFYWASNTTDRENALTRFLRLSDAILPLRQRASVPAHGAQRASHLVRFNLPNTLFRAHIARITKDARQLSGDQVLHLWWHPHNLGDDPTYKLRRVEQLLDQVLSVAPRGTTFRTMREVGRSAPFTPLTQ